ncbi:hypothetical protein PIB30_001661 [Stylosanthes scabra]|uniref:Uncharacterized protein n=1 Tax=Stylosanthes scabra TaxID=79078 RepID=A0ABU6T3D1_9FABA|nr:hypothetical protein [Stylosanthes scabra]
MGSFTAPFAIFTLSITALEKLKDKIWYPEELDVLKEKNFLFTVTAKVDNPNIFQPSIITINKLTMEESLMRAFRSKYKLEEIEALVDGGDVILSQHIRCEDPTQVGVANAESMVPVLPNNANELPNETTEKALAKLDDTVILSQSTYCQVAATDNKHIHKPVFMPDSDPQIIALFDSVKTDSNKVVSCGSTSLAESNPIAHC